MKFTTLYSENGDEIVAPNNRIEYLTSKGWSVDRPKAKRKAKETEEIE